MAREGRPQRGRGGRPWPPPARGNDIARWDPWGQWATIPLRLSLDLFLVELAVLRFLIDHVLRQRGELLVGGLFLVQVLAQQLVYLVIAQQLGVGADAAVARDLVVLDLLGRGDQRRVHHRG